MTKRLKILENSLIKKETAFSRKLSDHFKSVKEANGQPLNDKRNGHTTIRRWDRQNNALINQQESIEKTKNAIENEQMKIVRTKRAYDNLPEFITKLIDNGTLIQWRKHPTTFFVKGVEKARLCFKEGVIIHKYVSKIECNEQYGIFRDVFNSLNSKQKETVE